MDSSILSFHFLSGSVGSCSLPHVMTGCKSLPLLGTPHPPTLGPDEWALFVQFLLPLAAPPPTVLPRQLRGDNALVSTAIPPLGQVGGADSGREYFMSPREKQALDPWASLPPPSHYILQMCQTVYKWLLSHLN